MSSESIIVRGSWATTFVGTDREERGRPDSGFLVTMFCELVYVVRRTHPDGQMNLSDRSGCEIFREPFGQRSPADPLFLGSAMGSANEWMLGYRNRHFLGSLFRSDRLKSTNLFLQQLILKILALLYSLCLLTLKSLEIVLRSKVQKLLLQIYQYL